MMQHAKSIEAEPELNAATEAQEPNPAPPVREARIMSPDYYLG